MIKSIQNKNLLDAPRWLVVSHDAGGAEIISSWIRSQPDINFIYIINGPAIKIFFDKIDSLSNYEFSDIDEILSSVDQVLTGTSWASELEKECIKRAKMQGVRVVSYIDHWTNYPQRFLLKNEIFLPDEVWVGDIEAYKLSKSFFPTTPVHLEPNIYLQEIQTEIETLGRATPFKKEHHILYVCEPIEEHAEIQCGDGKEWGYDEYSAMEYFFSWHNLLKEHFGNLTIKVRLHPSEPQGKYDKILKTLKNVNIELSSNTSLIEDCIWGDWVVGCESMAMLVGLLAKKKVFTSIPPGGHPCRLPHKEIKSLAQLGNYFK